MHFPHQSAKIIGITKPIIEGCETAEEFIAYCARVSNPSNQMNHATAPKLLSYLLREKHFSPFEMAHVVMEINTTRDIGRQLLRHSSFRFQEFSQRYTKATEFIIRQARLQDQKNRQNSIVTEDEALQQWFYESQNMVINQVENLYNEALEKGIAKEQARALLPEGLTMSRLYMAGSVRSWLHFVSVRIANGTQKEASHIAQMAWDQLVEHFPSLKSDELMKQIMDMSKDN